VSRITIKAFGKFGARPGHLYVSTATQVSDVNSPLKTAGLQEARFKLKK
jgi:hypothetical protein